jgi:hypothetical protein
MPLEKPADHALGDINQTFCAYCTDEQGNLKPYEDILKNMANFLVNSQGIDQSAALTMAKNVLSNQPEWKGRS